MKLSIAEGLYLIALDDEEGRLLAAAEKRYIPGVLSAAILELYLTEKINLNQGAVEVKDPSTTQNGILDSVLSRLETGPSIIEQIKSLTGHFNHIKEDLDKLLSERGILRREETKLLWIPLSERMGNANYAYEKEIRNILRAMVFKNAKPTPSFVVLMSLVYDCGILDEVFRDKDELIDAEKVAKDVVDSIVVNPETSQVLKDLRTYFNSLD
ncbi:MAG: GPP34 family phosphoprotein [Bacteroidota bacterium]